MEIFQRLRSDYEYYAGKCLKIRDKAGKLVPFVFNKPQKYLHEKIEEQKKRTGKVRVVIVKGRQQGCCYSPEMRVLTSGYKWVKIKDIMPGDVLFAVTENLGTENRGGRREERRIRYTKVEAKVYQKALTYEVLLDNGVRLVVTGGHRHLCLQRGGDLAQWREVSKTKVGDYLRAFCHKPDRVDLDFEDGWFSGLLDGEGCFGANPQVRIGVTQVAGLVLERAKAYLNNNGINFYTQEDKRKRAKPVFTLRVDCLVDIVKLLGLTSPIRFLSKHLLVNRKLPKNSKNFNSWAKVLSIRPLEEQVVIDLQTSEKTFVCEGMVSHNSTYITGRFFHISSLVTGMSVFILAHIADSTQYIFKMVGRFYDHAPDPIKPAIDVSNKRNLEFRGLGSSYSIGTAGSADIGRSMTFQLFHGSECAFWPNTDDLMTGVLQGVADAPGTEIVFESTAKGMGNLFHKLALAGLNPESEIMTIFIPWFWSDEYRKEPPDSFVPTIAEISLMDLHGLDESQIYWRRRKIIDVFGDEVWKFMREYPCTLEEAFITSGETLVSAQKVIEARKSALSDIVAPLVMGVDPARSGDRTVLTLRRGRAVVKYWVFSEMDEMTLAGIVAEKIDKYDIFKCFIDVGLGYGTVDRLKELGYGAVVTGIHFGGGALEKDIYQNKRAEMYDHLRMWFEEGASIPDDDDFATDILIVPPLEQTTSRGLLALPPKEKIKNDYGRSPDIADSLALTFAFPVNRMGARQTITRATPDITRRNSPLNTVRRFAGKGEIANAPKTFRGGFSLK